MTIQEARDYAIQQEPTFLTMAKRIGHQQSYVCPCCQNGSKDSKTGITRIPRTGMHPKYHCFGCDFTGDVFDLAKEFFHCETKREMFNAVYEYYGLTVDGIGLDTNSEERKKIEEARNSWHNEMSIPQIYVDYTDYFKGRAKELDPSYLLGRGLSEDTQKHYMVGLDRKWLNPKTVENYKKEGKNFGFLVPSERVIIPSSRFSYLARATVDGTTEQRKAYAKQKVGSVTIFNERYSSRNDVVFLAEGEIDAMSFYEASEGNVEAAGLGGTSNWTKFVAKCADGKPFFGKAIVLALDNDEPGRVATEKIKTALEGMGVIVVVMEYEGKDPNNALVENRYAFASAITEAYDLAMEKLTERKEAEKRAKEPLDMNMPEHSRSYEMEI